MSEINPLLREEPIPDDNIIGWKSDRNWLYITLLGVKHTNSITPKPDPNNLIKELVIDSFDESVQIAVLLTKKIQLPKLKKF